MVREHIAAARALALAGALLTASCSDDEPVPPQQTGSAESPDAATSFSRRSYERSFVFARLDGDSLFLVPWMFETVATPELVTRQAAGWIARGGIWDAFYQDRWDTPPSRAPDRVLPHGDLSFLVREGDAIDGIVFERGSRSLELVLGDVRAAWVGSRGETVDVLEGAAYLSDQRVEGIVLQLARASVESTVPGGDWALLLSGDSALFVVAADTEHGGDVGPVYRGWADLEDGQLQWPEVVVDWAETQAFPPARRDVPVAWGVRSTDGTLEGELEALSAEIQPGAGPGPLLPVRALFEVVGEVSTAQGRFEVRGLLVHERR